MAPRKVTPIQYTQSAEMLSETIESSSNSSDSGNEKSILKKKVHGIFFFLNVFGLYLACFETLFDIFGVDISIQDKGKLAGGIFAYNCAVIFPTLFYLAKPKMVIQQFFLLDTLLIANAIAVVAFISMIMMFDQGGMYYYKEKFIPVDGEVQICFKVIEISCSLSLFMFSTMIKVMLLSMDWKKWQLIFLKISLMIIALTFFFSGIFFIYFDSTYSNHLLRDFDIKVHDFMVMFIFAVFGCFYEYYNKISDLDYTGMFKYVYKVKNVDEKYQLKKRLIIERQIKSIRQILTQRDFGEMRTGVRK